MTIARILTILALLAFVLAFLVAVGVGLPWGALAWVAAGLALEAGSRLA